MWPTIQQFMHDQQQRKFPTASKAYPYGPSIAPGNKARPLPFDSYERQVHAYNLHGHAGTGKNNNNMGIKRPYESSVGGYYVACGAKRLRTEVEPAFNPTEGPRFYESGQKQRPNMQASSSYATSQPASVLYPNGNNFEAVGSVGHIQNQNNQVSIQHPWYPQGLTNMVRGPSQ